MKCPQCKGKMTPAPEVKQMAIECGQCGGVWYAGGLDGALVGPADSASATEKSLPDVDPSHFEILETALECPRCESVPLCAVIDRHSNAQSSICGQCRGVWLSAHHYGDLLKNLSADIGKPRADAFGDPDDTAGSQGVRKEEGAVTWDDVSAYFQSLQYKIFEKNPKLRKIVESLERSLPL